MFSPCMNRLCITLLYEKFTLFVRVLLNQLLFAYLLFDYFNLFILRRAKSTSACQEQAENTRSHTLIHTHLYKYRQP